MFNTLSNATRQCDVDPNGFPSPAGLGATVSAKVGWNEEEMTGYDIRYGQYVLYYLFTIPTPPTVPLQIENIWLQLNLKQTVVGTETGNPMLRILLAPQSITENVLRSWDTSYSPTNLPSVPSLMNPLVQFEQIIPADATQVQIDLTTTLQPLLNQAPFSIVLALHVIPGTIHAGAPDQIAGAEVFSSWTDDRDPRIQISYSTEEGQAGTWIFAKPLTCGNGICEFQFNENYNTCPEDCFRESQKPEIEIGTYSYYGCQLPSAPPSPRIQIHEQLATVSDAIQALENSSFINFNNCINYISPSNHSPQPLIPGIEYNTRWGRDFINGQDYPFVVRITDNSRIHSVKILNLSTNETLVDTFLDGNWGRNSWPGLNTIYCGTETRNVFGMQIGFPKYCQVDHRELAIPLKAICKNGQAEIKVIALDVFGNQSERTILFQPMQTTQRPRIMTPEMEILPINKYKSSEVLHYSVMSGDSLFFDFSMESPLSLKSIQVKLITQQQPDSNGNTLAPNEDILYDGASLACPDSDSVLGKSKTTFRFQNLYPLLLNTYFGNATPAVLGDRDIFYNGIPTMTLRIAATDASGGTLIKNLPIDLLPSRMRWNWLQNITAAGMKRSPSSSYLLEQEGFFVNFYNSRRDAKWYNYFDFLSSWSFIKTYFQTYYTSDGRKLNIRARDVVPKVAVCVLAATLGFGVYECAYANYVLWAPVYNTAINLMPAWCTGFATAFQMWRTGKIKWNDFDACRYLESGTGNPCPTTQPLSASCYFDCCRSRNNENACTDDITANDLMRYLAGMQGKTLTGEYLHDFLLNRQSFKGINNILTHICRDKTGNFLGYAPSSFKGREDFLSQFCDPRRNIEEPYVISIDNGPLDMKWPPFGEAHSIAPTRMQRAGNSYRMYVYDPNAEYLSYGLRCLRKSYFLDYSDSAPGILSKWINVCGKFQGIQNVFDYEGYDHPLSIVDADEGAKDLYENSNGLIYPYIHIDLQREKFKFHGYEQMMFVSTPHKYNVPPISSMNAVLEVIRVLKDSLNEKKSNTKSIDATDLEGFNSLPSDTQMIQRELVWEGADPLLYYLQWGGEVVLSATAQGNPQDRLEITSTREARSIRLRSKTLLKPIEVKNLAFYKDQLRTTNEDFFIDDSGQIRTQNYSHLVDAKIQTSGTITDLEIRWQDRHHILIENRATQSIAVFLTLGTSYMPYLEEFFNGADEDARYAVAIREKLPFERELSLTLDPGMAATIEVPNWRKLPETKILVEQHDVDKASEKKSSWYSCNSSVKTGNNSPTFLFGLVVSLILFGRRRKRL